jgi:hypothetical protein
LEIGFQWWKTGGHKSWITSWCFLIVMAYLQQSDTALILTVWYTLNPYSLANPSSVYTLFKPLSLCLAQLPWTTLLPLCFLQLAAHTEYWFSLHCLCPGLETAQCDHHLWFGCPNRTAGLSPLHQTLWLVGELSESGLWYPVITRKSVMRLRATTQAQITDLPGDMGTGQLATKWQILLGFFCHLFHPSELIISSFRSAIWSALLADSVSFLALPMLCLWERCVVGGSGGGGNALCLLGCDI